MGALAGVERLVLLGDTLELRQGPPREALAVAGPLVAELGAALGSAGEIVLVPGNHDHALAAPWLARRAQGAAAAPLGLEQTVEHLPGEPLARLAEAARPATLRASYPGSWLRPDVYATHGHYLDAHITVPTFERLGVGAMGLLAGPLPARATPADYEARQAPLYAWLDAVAQATPAGRGAGAHGSSAQLLRSLSGGRTRGRRTARLAALRVGASLAIAAANRAGLGPLQTDLSSLELRRASLRALEDVLARLDVRAEHVLFGHTHRAGPWPHDDAREWRTAAGARLWNTGSWVYERSYLTRRPGESPYWPGVVLELDAAGPPRLRSLFGYRSHADLAPAGTPP